MKRPRRNMFVERMWKTIKRLYQDLIWQLASDRSLPSKGRDRTNFGGSEISTLKRLEDPHKVDLCLVYVTSISVRNSRFSLRSVSAAMARCIGPQGPAPGRVHYNAANSNR